MTAPRREFVRTPAPGVTLQDDGAIFCVFAGEASAVWLCLFGTAEVPHEQRLVALSPVGGGRWAARVDGVGVGTRYGYRVEGEWNPGAGHRHNAAKLLLDPYAHAVEGEVAWRPEVFGHTVDSDFHGDDTVRDDRDSAPFAPRGVVVGDSFDWGDEERGGPLVAMADSVIYELHVKGFSQLNPAVPEELRGTYAGLAHPASIAHLSALGVTCVELLPIHAFTHEPHLTKLGLRNYWGYNTLGFFAPHAPYAAASTPEGVIREVKSMIKALHAAGIEVILDVVYNHTAEQGGHEGATLSLRGFDNAAYYRLDGAGRDVDVTGCGNSVDIRHPASMRLVLDSLRHWVSEYHVDGFRFDLAVTLGRGPGGDYDPNAALLMAMRADPVLSGVKLIAEPWDVGPNGWQTGHFPEPFSEWNDRFRNSVRDFWLAEPAAALQGRQDAGSVLSDLATRLAGSADLFDDGQRLPEASLNYVTAHDGFTLADLTAYEMKHNEANGEQNRDGSDDNRSWNHGFEGWPEPDDPASRGLMEHRMRSMRNILGTLLLAAGVPMLTAGDEFARTQRGNNNAYCQDSPIGWLEWDLSADQRDLMATSAWLVALRNRFSVLRHQSFFPGTTACGEADADLRWFAADGTTMTAQQWSDPATRTVQAFFDGSGDHEESLLVVLHGGLDDTAVTLPAAVGVETWEVLWNSAVPVPDEVSHDDVPPGAPVAMPALSMAVLTPSS